jgi:Ca-activated chloride channel family protein
MKRLFSIISILLLLKVFPAYSQEEQPTAPRHLTRILFVFDASQSMAGTWESDEKINIARQILIELVDSLQKIDNVQMALRVYGHQSPVPPQDCSDTKLEVAFGINTASKIRQKLRFITPKGTTPIAHSLEMAVNDFPPCDNCRNIIILITDGIEACDGDPCEVSEKLLKNGIILKPFVIGIGIDPGFRETFDCVGYYYNAQQEHKFKETLGFVINQVLNSTTAQVNLLDVKGEPTETNVNMTFYDRYSNRIIYNFVHTMNHKGVPDTLEIDHLINYRFKVHTIPAIEIDSVSIVPGKHSIIAVDAPQGYMVVKTNNGKEYEGLNFIVRKHDDMQTLHNQPVGQVEKYLIGNYDIEVPTVPRLMINNIEVLQSHTTTVELPEPGNVVFLGNTNGYGSIYLMKEKDQEWVYNLNPALRQQSILLQPGTYRIVWRPAGSKNTLYTITREFIVESGKNIKVDL